MATAPATLEVTHVHTIERESRKVLLDSASNELVFGVVGHAGAGTSFIASQLENLLKQTSLQGVSFDVSILKAREMIQNWASKNGKTLSAPTNPPSLSQVEILQDYGDQMRRKKQQLAEKTLLQLRARWR